MVFTGIVRRERMVRNSDPNPASELLVPVLFGSSCWDTKGPIRARKQSLSGFLYKKRVNTPPAKAGGFGLRLKAGSIGPSAD